MKNIHLPESTLAIVFLLFFHISTFAQDNTAKITFLESSYDFGTLKEAAGNAEHTFQFVNTSTDSVKLTSVRASCGCTTPYWEKSTLMPGDTGRIEVAYNPLNRPGKFSKSITISTSKQANMKVLEISGYVEPMPRSINDEFPTELGGIRTKSRFINFGNITTEKPVTTILEVFNQTADTISLLDRYVSADFITVSSLPLEIPPKASVQFEINYLPKVQDDLGFMNAPLVLFTDELENSNKSLNVVATLNEYFPPMTEEELEQAPKISFDVLKYDFGHIDEGEQLSYNFKFENTGQDSLNIRRTKTTCDCTVSELDKMDYAPGEEGEIKVTYDSKGRRGTQIKRITLFTNDPTNPTQDLILKAYVRDN